MRRGINPLATKRTRNFPWLGPFAGTDEKPNSGTGFEIILVKRYFMQYTIVN
ncbi:hypothetical protein TREAZ_2636 [Leadbettera azotonutricia ZAS-9]|uniref:Uncharacterized protein n=1 Tax=Leadbettera azotonutricia (strain ATCC BAA-888 / DSM 13862 / ZAS-9) TaxID=545695 RepID=F5YED4_LEAAZ|nr:hypothetical protein TREAZ_2636 [Leadbettera azotonutricia ZAS-9]